LEKVYSSNVTEPDPVEGRETFKTELFSLSMMKTKIVLSKSIGWKLKKGVFSYMYFSTSSGGSKFEGRANFLSQKLFPKK
jgi:hypothetical protein